MIRTVIVEDRHEIREGFASILAGTEGFECCGAFSNAESALEEIPALRPDVVVMDINLPGISGIECIKKLKEKDFRGQFMMFTVYDDDDNIFNALKAGASGYLLKKTEPARFIEAIRELAGGGSPMTAHIARKVVDLFRNPNGIPKDADVLSPREKEVLTLIAKGLLYKEIADRLSISTGTVKQHIHKIYEKLHVQNKTEAINKYYDKKFLPLFSLLGFFRI
jgi:DNA-binding NarL/FixJ family response regulator